MIAFPNAKINLGLNILRKRRDGYHDIESCLYPIPWYDAIEIIESKAFGFYSYGLPIPKDSQSNLCIRAYELLRKHFQLPCVEIHLLKKIPIGAGLGGGSADGVFTLKLLNDLFALQIGQEELAHYALLIGSDCPFFVRNTPSIATDRGEILENYPMDLKRYYLAIFDPGIHISTKEAYAEATPSLPDMSVREILNQGIASWKDLLVNDFETSIFNAYPHIKHIKNQMYNSGALYSSMTGSGSAVFGLFAEEPKHQDWTIWHLANPC